MSGAREDFEAVHTLPQEAQYDAQRDVYRYRQYPGVDHPVNDLYAAFCNGRDSVGIQEGERAEAETVPNPALALLTYIVEQRPDESRTLIECWYRGDFEAIRREWDGVPDSVFIGADPLYTAEEE